METCTLLLLLTSSTCVAVLVLVVARLLRMRLTPAPRPGGVRLVCVLGSGGHTAEMVRLVRSLEPAVYSPRTYVLAAGDTLSEAKLAEAEAGRAGQYRVAR